MSIALWKYAFIGCAAAFAVNAMAQVVAPAPAPVSALPAKTTQQMIDEIAERWTGDYTNQRQVDNNIARGGQAVPKLTRDLRKMRVVKLDAPQLGKLLRTDRSADRLAFGKERYAATMPMAI